MKRRKLYTLFLCTVISLSALTFSSCGRTGAYWGVHSKYNFDDGRYYGDGPHRHKPPKKKKAKKHSKKHNKKHHHHDDD
ncbi:MAG: hypothetical protein NC043_06255 [Muribaculaceae bacterium]|nr:hypothetical protein [Muribaculaceae bacterium]